MNQIVFVLSILVAGNVFSNQIDNGELSIPSIELVTTIHEFCLEQNFGQDEHNTDLITLQCVNSDLEISTYKTFKTYTELTSFISQVEGE